MKIVRNVYDHDCWWDTCVTPATAARILGLTKEDFAAFVEESGMPTHHRGISRVKSSRDGVIFGTARRFALSDLAKALGVEEITKSKNSKYLIKEAA